MDTQNDSSNLQENDSAEVYEKASSGVDKKKLGIALAVATLVSVGIVAAFLINGNISEPESASQDTNEEVVEEPLEAGSVPVFAFASSVQYLDEESQKTVELFALEDTQTPLALYDDGGELTLVYVDTTTTNLDTAKSTIYTKTTGGEVKEIYTSATGTSYDRGGQRYAFDEALMTLYLEEFYADKALLTGYETNIVAIDLSSGTREVLLTDTAFSHPGRGPVFPVGVLDGTLIIGETSCYECDGPGKAKAYFLKDGALKVLVDFDADGGVVCLAGLSSCYVVVGEPGGLGYALKSEIESYTPKITRIDSDLSTHLLSYTKEEKLDGLVGTNGVDTTTMSPFGNINTHIPFSGDEYAPVYRTMATLRKDGSLSYFALNTSTLSQNSGNFVRYAQRTRDGVFIVGSDQSGELNGFFGKYLSLEDTSTLVDVTLQTGESGEFVRDPRYFGAHQIPSSE